jgi:hypothetical protein
MLNDHSEFRIRLQHAPNEIKEVMPQLNHTSAHKPKEHLHFRPTSRAVPPREKTKNFNAPDLRPLTSITAN